MDKTTSRPSRPRGQVLAGVVILLALMLIIVPTMVMWTQRDSLHAVKNRQSTTAFNLAEAALDRGMWKLKSSTASWTQAVGGVSIGGYHFDVTYTDVPGGTYRINFSSGVYNGLPAITIWGEGRDSLRKETRSIQALYQNLAIPGAIIAGGTFSDSGQTITHWGPEMSMGNMTVATNSPSYTSHTPRKLSKQAVLPYDSNGLTPPNTDNLEWWSGYDVPQLPQFDFTTSSMSLRNQAVLSNTLNCYGNWNATNNMVPCGGAGQTGSNKVANMGINGYPGAGDCISYDNTNHVIKYDRRWNDNAVWYWDNDVNIVSPGIKGTFIIRGNLWVSGGDWYGLGQNENLYGAQGAHCRPWGTNDMVLHVPPQAWMEYQKIDNTATNQYPGDNGNRNSVANYILGSLAADYNGTGQDLGIYGFVYVGVNANFAGSCDIYGAIWVVGNWAAAGDNFLFYNDQLNLPMLNVVLVRQSWKEVSPSTQAWP